MDGRATAAGSYAQGRMKKRLTPARRIYYNIRSSSEPKKQSSKEAKRGADLPPEALNNDQYLYLLRTVTVVGVQITGYGFWQI